MRGSYKAGRTISGKKQCLYGCREFIGMIDQPGGAM